MLMKTTTMLIRLQRQRRSSLLVLAAALCVAVLACCVGRGQAAPVNVGSFPEVKTTVFQDETEFLLWARRYHSELSSFEFGINSLVLSKELAPRSNMPIGFIGSSLTFDADKTNLPLHFRLSKEGSREDKSKSAYTADATADHEQQQEKRTDAQTEEPTKAEFEGVDGFRLRIANQVPELQLSERPQGSFFAAEFSTCVYHKGVEYQQLFGVGFSLTANEASDSESFSVYDLAGNRILRVRALPSSPTESFIGVVSSVAISRVVFDEENNDANHLALRQILFITNKADLLDGVPQEYAALFWICFNLFIVLMLALDMLLLQGRNKQVNLKDALKWSVVWIAMALAFNGAVFWFRGRGPAAVWFTAYILEKSLSVDNLFVFLTIFASFQTPIKYQHKVLTWGIGGAVVLRALFIFLGVALVERFAWLLACFGAFLAWTGVKTLYSECFEAETDGHSMFEDTGDRNDNDVRAAKVSEALESNTLLRLLRLVIPMSTSYDDQGRFFTSLPFELFGADAPPDYSSLRPSARVCARMFHCLKTSWRRTARTLKRCTRLEGRRATPLFAALVVIETTDMIFAADSIPAVLSVTTDPFIAYTSNIFAVLGLRALYFALAAAMSRFMYLGSGLGFILLFIGGKMLFALVGIHFSIESTLLVVAGTLTVAIVLSICYPPKHAKPDHRRASSSSLLQV
eukprot:m.52679 g.52679  ORF g.52679 m.52679 type:complete len:688 (-) comp13093_c0_seq2:706-2769(-)